MTSSAPVSHLTLGMSLIMMMVMMLVDQVAAGNENEVTSLNEGGGGGDDHHETEGGTEEHGEEIEPAAAVLFPWFAQILGVLVFFVATRYVLVIPYTAAMFLLGVVMGVSEAKLTNHNYLMDSLVLWSGIDGEVLLLVFLPGLIFRDAFGLNVHLFHVSLVQCLIFAFPMVLAGTSLVALVVHHIFPHDWSFNLSMTFGSILSATDPVAVSALLQEVGAPPRLKMLISGESLLNDGSAIVFFTIFRELFYTELGVEGLGQESTWGEGIALFCRMSMGGAAIGLAFGMALVFVLYRLNRRLNEEENILQVAATVTVAYLTYYIADVVTGTSGVLAVVVCGVVTKAFGGSFINDWALMDNFWVLVEHLLNTLLFTLGGVVWGDVISNEDDREFNGRDWGYLLLLYVFAMLIRFFLLFVFFPLYGSIGLKSNWREVVFMSYGGLRGAVGIALAIAIDEEVRRETDDPVIRDKASKLFGFVGGIALLTLIINGTTAGPVLKALGLTKSTEVREKVTEIFKAKWKETILEDMITLLTKLHFQNVDFALVKDHIPAIEDLTFDELRDAVLKNRETVPASQYRAPVLTGFLPYLVDKDDLGKYDMSWLDDFDEQTVFRSSLEKHCVLTDRSKQSSELKELTKLHGSLPETKELRLLFLELVKAAYQWEVERGFLDSRAGSPGFVYLVLSQGLEFAVDGVNQGDPLEDWKHSKIIERPLEHWSEWILNTLNNLLASCTRKRKEMPTPSQDYQTMRTDLEKALAFIQAHRRAQDYFREFLGAEGVDCATDEIAASHQLVLLESNDEIRQAEELLESVDRMKAEVMISHMFCIMLLNKAAVSVEKVRGVGLLHEKEADEILEEIDESLIELRMCTMESHPGEISMDEKLDIVQKLLKKDS